MDGARLTPPLSKREIDQIFLDPDRVKQFPPILSLEQAADLVQIPVATLRSWRSAGALRGCSRKLGKHVRILRDRFLEQIFNA
jgi:hypothetical protein